MHKLTESGDLFQAARRPLDELRRWVIFLTEFSPGKESVEIMCRNIKTLHNFAPPATAAEVRASSLQFVRKLSGFTKPSKANEAAFNQAIEEVAAAAHKLLDSLVTTATPRDRQIEAAKARERSANRFGAQSNAVN